MARKNIRGEAGQSADDVRHHEDQGQANGQNLGDHGEGLFLDAGNGLKQRHQDAYYHADDHGWSGDPDGSEEHLAAQGDDVVFIHSRSIFRLRKGFESSPSGRQ